jgi:hypothetical protein
LKSLPPSRLALRRRIVALGSLLIVAFAASSA